MGRDTQRLVTRADFETTYHQQPEVVHFVDQIIAQHQLSIEPESDEFKQLCLQSLEMLYRLDQRKSQYKDQVLYGNQPPAINAPGLKINDAASDLSKITIRKLIEEYCEVKEFIEKVWKNPDTVKGKKEYLDRIAEIFDFVAKKKNPVVSTLTRSHAREMRRVLSLIPTNMKKKYPTLTLREVVKKSEKGEISENERLKSNGICTVPYDLRNSGKLNPF